MKNKKREDMCSKVMVFKMVSNSSGQTTTLHRRFNAIQELVMFNRSKCSYICAIGVYSWVYTITYCL